MKGLQKMMYLKSLVFDEWFDCFCLCSGLVQSSLKGPSIYDVHTENI